MIIKVAIFLAVVLIVAAFAAWAFLPARHLPGNRARYLRIRLHLRLHPGKGFACAVSLHLRWGRFAALRRSGRIRPALPLGYRFLDPREHSVFLGRAHYRHGLRVPLEEHLLVMAPPRTFKTAFLADVILRYPGPVIATSTKPDVHALTSTVRDQLGPVHVFNPQHIGGVPSTFCWSPVDGCQDPATAIRRADAFAFAVSQQGIEDGTFWSAKASDYLRGYFHAAALARYDPRAVAAWVSGADPHIPERILMAAGARQWACTLAELRSEAHKTAATVRMVMTRSLAFMADPALAACVLPAPGTGFDIPVFLARAGTVYMVAEAVSEDAPVAPLFAAMASEIHWIAAQTGQASPSARLDPPLLMGLDEVTQICPVPLPSWLSDSGGKGIQVVAVVLEGQKAPATRHSYKDATTDPEQITGWFGRDPGLNVAIATGAPGPDVLDVDVHGPAGNGYAALGRLHCAGLLEDAYGYVRTPSGGLHIYFTGTAQHCGHLAGHHVDFRAAGGYVLTPPSQVDGHPYLPWGTPGRDGTLSWDRACRALPSPPQRPRTDPRPAPDRDLDTLGRWLARQPEGNRNAGLYWAANRALETDAAADLSPLAGAARQAGLGDQEISRTLDSARRTGQARPEPHGYQAEAVT